MKKILICSSILIVTLFFAGCDLFSSDSSTTMTVVNDSSETITAMTVQSYIGAQERGSVNSLEEGDTVAPGEKVVFKLAPKLVDNHYLEIVVYSDLSSNTDVIYDAEANFTLHFLGSSEDTKFSISGEGARLDSDT